MPRQARRFSRAGRGRSHAVFGRSARVGGGEPLGADLTYHGTKFVPQAPDRRRGSGIHPPHGRRRRQGARRPHRTQSAPGGAHRQKVPRRRARRRRYGFHRRHRPDQGGQHLSARGGKTDHLRLALHRKRDPHAAACQPQIALDRATRRPHRHGQGGQRGAPDRPARHGQGGGQRRRRDRHRIGNGASFKCATACSTARPARSTRSPKRLVSRVPTYRASKKRRWRSFAGRWAVEAPPSLCYNGLAAQKVARQGGSPCTTTTLSPPCF